MENIDFNKFEGKEVRVYLHNGTVLTGRATFKGDWVEVEEVKKGGKVAVCNRQYIVSISM